MPAKPEKDTEAYLDGIYSAFHRLYDRTSPGWGQFLDVATEHQHVGRYGTSAGAVVLSVSGHGSDPSAVQIRQKLEDFLNEESDGNAEHSRQNLPLAFLYMGLKALAQPADAKVGDRVTAEFQLRRLPNSFLWGAYWIDADIHDESPSVLVSSIVLLALQMFSEPKEIPEFVQESGRKLEEYYLGDPQRHAEYAPLVLSALGRTLGPRLKKKTIKLMQKIAIQEVPLSRRYTFFYDYKPNSDTWSREYLIIPIALFFPIGLCATRLPGNYSLRARDVVRQLKSCLDQNQGLFKPGPTDRLSTLEQAIAAIALVSFHKCEEGTSAYRRASLKYVLFRERPNLAWTGSSLVLLTYAMLVFLVAGPPLLGLQLSAQEDFLVNASLFCVAVIENPVSMINRLLRRSK